jgi:hypothetical protein
VAVRGSARLAPESVTLVCPQGVPLEQPRQRRTGNAAAAKAVTASLEKLEQAVHKDAKNRAKGVEVVCKGTKQLCGVQKQEADARARESEHWAREARTQRVATEQVLQNTQQQQQAFLTVVTQQSRS